MTDEAPRYYLVERDYLGYAGDPEGMTLAEVNKALEGALDGDYVVIKGVEVVRKVVD